MKHRKYCHNLYLSEEEKIILEEKYKLSGMTSANAFIRHLIKYGFVFDVDYSELHEMNYQLGKIGNNINQIAHIANSTNTISQSEINKVKELMNQIWHIQESMLSKQPYIKQCLTVFSLKSTPLNYLLYPVNCLNRLSLTSQSFSDKST